MVFQIPLESEPTQKAKPPEPSRRTKRKRKTAKLQHQSDRKLPIPAMIGGAVVPWWR